MDHKKGIRTEDAVEWSISNYDNIRETHGNFTLYLWTGTCDLTQKTNIKISNPKSKYWISLCSDYKLRANNSIRAFNRLLKFAKLKNFELVCLFVCLVLNDASTLVGH